MRGAPRGSMGSVWLATLALILVSWVALATLQLSLAARQRSANRMRLSTAAVHLAEAGVAKALWEASSGNGGYKGEEDVPLDSGTFSVAVRREGGQLIVTATGWIPDKQRARIWESVRIVATPGGSVLTWQKL